MPDFDKPHIDISSRVQKRRYQSPPRNMGEGSAPRVRAEHGARIKAEMEAAFVSADEIRPEDERLPPPEGVYLEVDLRRGANPEKTLERKSDKIRLGATQKVDNDELRVALFVPDEARPVVEQIIDEYLNGEVNAKDEPPRRDKVEPIENIRRARLETFWTDDPSALPQTADETIWWEVWSFKGAEKHVRKAAQSLGLIVAEDHYWLKFPESTVIPIRAKRIEIELLLFATGSVAELRRASASPVFYLDMDAEEQLDWSEELAERVTWPGGDAPAVCLLDTGVNRGHMLIEPSLSDDDTLAVDADWGGFDHDGHGTGMAGLALHGDLHPRLSDTQEYALRHRIESVKVLPPDGFPENDPSSYGSITQSAASIAELNKPERSRVFCLAVTNENVSGARATTWSSAIDQLASGTMQGDDENAPRRLFIVSAGNIPAETDPSKIIPQDDCPIEDPAQSWNALTVGGYTNKTDIEENGYETWTPMADAGYLSPFSRTSVTWPLGRSPIKPDIVLEAGNRAINPTNTEALTLDSLGLLTTGEDEAQHPLRPFSATSAAAAQGGRLAAMLSAEHPDLWPETIRALLVHSAEWTPAMLSELNSVGGVMARYPMLRRFGHGVPSFERAAASAANHLALVAQNEIQPFSVDKGQIKFGDCHFYRLPWPKEVLEGIGEQDVRLKVTLSYFVEPNPGRFASIDTQRYQSFGLRFDLRQRTESDVDFIKRINALDRENPRGAGPKSGDNSGWKFGPNSVSSGSLHSDEWVGPAIQLAARNMICIKPVSGWWRQSAKTARQKSRYALVVTLSAPDVEIDLHTPIETIVDNEVGIEIEI
nr:S8 family peptidase [uncultured Hyphomonas sp.]